MKVAVAEVEDYYLDDGNGWEDDDEHGYEVVAQFVDEWARQSGFFLERDDLEEISENEENVYPSFTSWDMDSYMANEAIIFECMSFCLYTNPVSMAGPSQVKKKKQKKSRN